MSGRRHRAVVVVPPACEAIESVVSVVSGDASGISLHHQVATLVVLIINSPTLRIGRLNQARERAVNEASLLRGCAIALDHLNQVTEHVIGVVRRLIGGCGRTEITVWVWFVDPN